MRKAIEKLFEITFRDAAESRAKLMSGGRLGHYTSVDALCRILDSQVLWLRNVNAMNDFSEIRIGDSVWNATFGKDGPGHQFRQQLCSHYEGMSDFLDVDLPRLRDEILRDTFAASFSVHPGRDANDAEGRFGRLSMWRAYAANNGAALFLKPSSMVLDTKETQLMVAPMNYVEPTRPLERAAEVIEAFQDMPDQHRPSKAPLWQSFMMSWYVLTLVTSKHAAFREESEWRVFWSRPLIEPYELPAVDHTIAFQPRVFRGVVQQVGMVDLVLLASKLPATNLLEAIDEVLIGPSSHPEVQHICVADALARLGFEDAESRARLADIPLRSDDN